ncbi:CMP-N-acetylneuraminate-beta-galactosamide-alpha-2,3-sialyltransferase 4 [Latimeria chalumnae]|uniref:CMP-N-acetylneuraminate-beta-galactosamide- alpha-2,3-sialyltransferase 4 n=1 Tax=Latimeria chalumnae TaxID=7897 RepID=UPI00313B72A8
MEMFKEVLHKINLKYVCAFIILATTVMILIYQRLTIPIERNSSAQSPACQPGFARQKAACVANFSDADLFLKMENFFWTFSQSTHPLPFGVKGNELFLTRILAKASNYEMPEDIESLPCKTCVVVGNGYIIKNSSLGNEIDKYDVVIRLNSGPVRGYEKDVGTKTTMRLFYPESAILDTYKHDTSDTLEVFVPYKENDLRWLKSNLYNEQRSLRGLWKSAPLIWNVNPQNVRILHPYFNFKAGTDMLNATSKKPIRPTIGFVAITAALHYCDVVHIAGFGYPKMSDGNQLIHYFRKDTMNVMEE